MPHNLPIYDNIVSIINDETNNITIDDKTSVIKHINNYSETHEILFAIIRCYQLNNSSNMTKLPFYSKYLKTKNGYKFDIDNLPDKLIKIIIEFYNLHRKSIDDKKN